MAFLRSILWVPMVFGVIMGGLALARLFAEGFSIEFVSIPADIMSAYSRIVDVFALILFQIPFQAIPPDYVLHALTFWIVIGSSSARFVFIAQGRDPRATSGDLPTWRAAILMFFLGPLAVFLILDTLIRPIRHAVKYPKKNDPRLVVFRRLRNEYLLVLMLNPIIAAGLLWWNAAEIERLTAGIG